MSEASYFLSVFLHDIAPVNILSSLFITAALYLDKVARFSEVAVVWGFLFVYLLAMTAFACYLSTIVSRVSAAQQQVALFTFMCAVIYIALLAAGVGDGLKFALCCIPMFAVHFIGDRMVVLEGNNRGLTWETVTEPFTLRVSAVAEEGVVYPEATLLWVGLYVLLSCFYWLYMAWFV
jgi:hypothetical protein